MTIKQFLYGLIPTHDPSIMNAHKAYINTLSANTLFTSNHDTICYYQSNTPTPRPNISYTSSSSCGNSTVNNQIGPLQQILAASFGAALTSLFVTPLDVIKTRKQARTIPDGKSLAQSIRFIVSKEGITGLWRGLAPAVVMQVPSTGLYYSTYDNIRRNIDEDWVYSPLVAGTSARLLAATVTSPFEYIRTVAQSSSSMDKKTGLGLLKNMSYKNMWTGLWPTILRDTPFSAIYWMCYESSKKKLRSHFSADNQPEIFLTSFASGALAGSLAATVTTPIDVVKTRIQSDANGVHIRMWDTAKQIHAEDGIKGFFRGYVPRMARVAPACAIMISSYEIFKELV
ncbi:solute carrier family 25 member [Acrasis kona]|uniref:Solute carrier family 25 member n=1 Tax=Acrasis kona TaxID=1008807 RepID=A0AAW2Z498_9EUKA